EELMSRGMKFLLHTLISIVLLSAVLWATHPPLIAHERSPDGPLVSVTLPWQFEDPAVGKELEVYFKNDWRAPARWWIIPDDELKAIRINGVNVSLAAVPPGGLSDYGNGFYIDLSSYLKPGDNTLLFTLDNHSGSGGLDIRPHLSIWQNALFIIALVPFVLGLGGIFGLRLPQIFLLIASLIPIQAYWSFTPWYERGHDAGGGGGHLDYVIWVATKLALPRPTDGWTFYHPPLYYICSAAVWKWAQLFALPGPEAVQVFSLSLWMVFLAASVGALNYSYRHHPQHVIAVTAALAFWPVGIMHSVRIGNDAMLYATVAVGMFFLVRWWRRQQTSDLLWMSFCVMLAFLSKSNAAAFAATAGALVAWRVVRPGKSERKKQWLNMAIFTAFAGCGVVLSLASKIYYYLHGQIGNWLIANVTGQDNALRVPVTIKAFLPLDIPTFLTAPWMRAYVDASGRGNFWNYLLRSALTGEFDLPGNMQIGIAYVWGVLLLTLIILALRRVSWPVIDWRSHSCRRHLPWLLAAALWLASILALRVEAPFASSNDFRYVLPMLVPILMWFAWSGRLAVGLLYAVVPISLTFFMTL
ncbi:MAG TPA: glycosyltransferase family 39 protein, partial [Rhodocyclaceae bacterium]|nr:glycosyltransferase family 39 protein [Rhodocyclaceae bacterium]